jgi:hypothetical protein
MSEVLERASAPEEDVPSAATATEPVADPFPSAAPAPAPAGPLRYLLAGLSGGAGTVHLAMVPSHMDEWAAEGVAFAIAGWVQLVMALLLVTRPSRALLRATIVVNAAFVGAWIVSRTAGSPFGPHAGHAESASFVDVTTVGFETALVLLAGLALLRPGWAARAGAVARGGALAGAMAVVVLASVVLASPSARNHAHGTHAGHGDAAAGDQHEHDASAGGLATRAGSPADDRGLSELNNGHHHEMVVQPLDAATEAELDDQLAITRQVAARYPTVADAEDAGYQRIGPYFPGIGAHYGKTGPLETNREGVFDRDTLSHPFAIIYDGTEPTSRVAGFMYLSLSDTEPEGFAGPNDVWHYHEQLCLKYQPNGEIDVPFGLDHEATEAQCRAAGARLLPISPWMVHVWSAPGWDDDPEVGTFGEVHTDLTCSDGTYFMLPIDDWVDHRLNVCRADAA